MIGNMDLLVGALVGAVGMLVIAWLAWGRRAGALTACRKQVSELTAAAVRLEAEAGALQAANAQLEAARKSLLEEKSRLEEEKISSEAVVIRAQSERSQLEGTVSRLQVEKAAASADLDRARFENQKLRERLSKAEDALQALEAALKEDLTAIGGIDEAMAYRLNRAGVRSARDLAAVPPARVEELAGRGANGLQLVLAARSAAGLRVDDLTRVDGIGPAIAKKLHQACIFTFAELGALTPGQLRAILGNRSPRGASEEEVLAQARALA